MNADELARNPDATAVVVHDLNADPRLPFDDATFDAATCCVSVDYLVRPVEVFADVGPGAAPGRAVRVHVLQPLLPDEGDQGLAGQRRPGPAGDRATPTSSAAAASTGPTLAHRNPGAPRRPAVRRLGGPACRVSAGDELGAGWRSRSSPAGPARGSWRGASRSPSRSGRRSATRRTGAGRSPASAIRRRASSCSGWRRPPTAPTAPGACSPATAAGTGCSGRCTAPGWPTSRRRATPATGCASTTPGSRRR